MPRPPEGRQPPARHEARAPSARLLAVVLPLLAAVLTGCGIRATSVPTDFGPAPSRASCALPAGDAAPESAQGSASVQIFLVCTSQLVAVDRSVDLPVSRAQDRVRVAQALLDQLKARPPAQEKQAGYTTDVRSTMTVTGGHKGDPPEALRLGTPVRDLTAYALAQIVCTLADSVAADDGGSVVLGGPVGGTEPLQRYRCTPEVRSRPGTTAPPVAPVAPVGKG